MINYLKLTLLRGCWRMTMNKKHIKARETNKRWSCINHFCKNSNTSFFPIGSHRQPTADTSLFSIGCMTWQHAVILESIWETDLTLTHFSVQRTGLLTPRLTCLLYFSLLLGRNYSKSNSLSPFYFFGQKFLSPTSLLSSFWRKFSKSNSLSSFWTKIF